jgi:hypothetical protein
VAHCHRTRGLIKGEAREQLVKILAACGVGGVGIPEPKDWDSLIDQVTWRTPKRWDSVAYDVMLYSLEMGFAPSATCDVLDERLLAGTWDGDGRADVAFNQWKEEGDTIDFTRQQPRRPAAPGFAFRTPFDCRDKRDKRGKLCG